MKKKDNGKYYPTDEDFKHQYFCFKHNIAFSLRKASYDEDLYYVEKYDLRTPLKTTYFREDNNKPHMPSNRKKFKEYEAYVKIFECYKQQYDLILNIKKNVKSEEQSNTKKDIKNNRQIDLLEMIEEVTNESKS